MDTLADFLKGLPAGAPTQPSAGLTPGPTSGATAGATMEPSAATGVAVPSVPNVTSAVPSAVANNPDFVKEMTGNLLRTVMAGRGGGDAIKNTLKRAAMSEVEKEFKNFLLKKGVSSELLGSISLSDVLKKTNQLKNLSDDQIWGGLKKIMSEKAGLSPDVADMVIGVMKENGVSFEDLKGVLGDKGLREDTLKDALKFLNPKAARLIAENPGCLRIFDLFKEKNELSMQDVLSVVAECQQAKEAWSAPEPSDSDGDYSDSYGRKGKGKSSDSDSDSEYKDEEEEEDDEEDEEDEDEEEEDEDEEEDEGEEEGDGVRVNGVDEGDEDGDEDGDEEEKNEFLYSSDSD